MEKISISDFCNVKNLSQLAYSPDGEKLAYVVSQPSEKENKYLSNIWVYENNKSRKLTTVGAESSFIWLDNENLLFPGDRNKNRKIEIGKDITVFNKINIHGGEAEELFTIPMKASSIQKVNGEEYLFIGTKNLNLIDTDNLEGEEKEEALKLMEEEKDYSVFDELPFWANAKGVVNKIRSGLYLYNVKTDKLQCLTSLYMNVNSFEYNKKSDKVLYSGNEYDSVYDQMDDLYVVGLHDDSKIMIELNHEYSLRSFAFMDNDIILAGTKGKRYGNNENPIFYIANSETGKITEIADIDPSMFSSVGSDCRHGGGKNQKATDNAWYFTETKGFNSYIVKIDRKGTETIVSPIVNGSVDCFDMYNGKFAYVAMRSNSLQEIYICEEGTTETKITDFNTEFLKNHKVSPVKHFTFNDKDGVEIDGWVIEPVDYDSNKTYPAILDVHGGPKTVYGENFFHEMQYWASEGYFVFFCNPRGGDGKGNEFADIRGKRYGVLDYNDIMEFTDKVLEMYPQIEKNHVGMTGGSYGGYMANWIVGHTDRFAAVASQRSISNFISKCLTTDIGYYHNLKAVQADPWTNPEDMWEKSPLKYADKCKTPTLFIQSDEDYRCWMCDALQMFTALKMHGVPSRVCLFHGENHELSRNGKPKHRIRRLKEITDWFDTYLKD